MVNNVVDQPLPAGAKNQTPKRIVVHAMGQYIRDTHTSIEYSAVDFLKKERFIREIELGDGMKRYELWPDDHHHHLICVECNSVKCIDMEHCLVNEEKYISEKSNFKIMEHSLKFFGLCENCQ